MPGFVVTAYENNESNVTNMIDDYSALQLGCQNQYLGANCNETKNPTNSVLVPLNSAMSSATTGTNTEEASSVSALTISPLVAFMLPLKSIGFAGSSGPS